MNTSSQFVVATHIMAVLAIRKETVVKSSMLSSSVNTNPVVIRRILGMLQKAGLVTSQTGPDGGSRLAHSANRITLREVYEAVEDNSLFHLHYQIPSQNCPVGTCIQDCLADVFWGAEAAMKTVLAKKSVAAIAKDILVRSGIMKKIKAGLSIPEIQEHYDFRAGRLVKKKVS